VNERRNRRLAPRKMALAKARASSARTK